MAVVKLGKPVKSNLGGDNGAMAYIINPAKTDGGRLVSSNYERTRTDHDALAEGMLDDNRRSPKGIRKNSRLAYHIKLSFSPDDPVTPERVHELGVEFARRITGGEYKFVVATHTDRHHLHDHIMVCAASQYGKHLKAELPKDIIDQWRAVSDEICRREGLSVVFNPVVEEQTRKMRGGTTAAGDAETPPARDPERVDEAPMRSANEPEATSRKASGGEPLERRYGMSMEEIYASAKGLGVKDRLRMLIDLTSSTAENFEDWRDMLDIRGVGVEVRGRHLTYTLKDTGFKVRDEKLGQAYDMTNIMAGLAHTPVIPITFNRRLVAKQTRKTVTVWLPGTHRKKKITFDAKRLVDDGGSTLRAFLPRDRDQIILDPSNRYAGKTPTTGLYQWFGEPTSRLEPQTTPERLPLRRGEGAERGDPMDPPRGRRRRQGTQSAAREGTRIARRTPVRRHRIARRDPTGRPRPRGRDARRDGTPRGPVRPVRGRAVRHRTGDPHDPRPRADGDRTARTAAAAQAWTVHLNRPRKHHPTNRKETAMPIEEQAEEKIQNVVQTIITGGARLMLRIPKGVAMALLRSGMKLAKTGVHAAGETVKNKIDSGEMSEKRLQRKKDGDLHELQLDDSTMREVQRSLKTAGIDYHPERTDQGQFILHFAGRDEDHIRAAVQRAFRNMGLDVADEDFTVEQQTEQQERTTEQTRSEPETPARDTPVEPEAKPMPTQRIAWDFVDP